MNLARSKNGLMVHKRECRFANPDRPWLWADDKNQWEVQRTMEYFGYQTCMICFPLPGTTIRRIKE